MHPKTQLLEQQQSCDEQSWRLHAAIQHYLASTRTVTLSTPPAAHAISTQCCVSTRAATSQLFAAKAVSSSDAQYLEPAQQRQQHIVQQLDQLSPLAVLKRGYSITSVQGQGGESHWTSQTGRCTAHAAARWMY